MPELSKRAEGDLESLPDALRKKAEAIIERLDAEPALGKKLKGRLTGKRSIWLGRTHRIIYISEPNVFVLTIAQRKDAYR